ncbi:MAG: hypothetical protein DRP82_06280 [Planctomycetota bacterium]|mgnify:CR=1 FL=1|nr:MAG: hypothetical protein DRP82_06280 [Planctomycetota bacterium]
MAWSTKTVSEIVRDAVANHISVPEFQREFVWDNGKVRDLVDSLFRDYPIGQFLVWKPPSPYGSDADEEEHRPTLWIIDGQQRATAFCLILGKMPAWWTEREKEEWENRKKECDILVKVVPDDEEGVQFSLPSAVRRQDPRWVSVREIIQASEQGTLVKFASEIGKRLKKAGKQVNEDMLLSLLLRVAEIRSRSVVVVEVGHEVEDVAEIFTRLNQAGVRVKEADTVFALAAVKNPRWAQNEYRKFRRDLDKRNWDLPPAVIIRTVTAIGARRARFKEVKGDFWEVGFLDAWEKTKKVISRVIKHLQDRGIVQSDLLPAKNVLIPVFVLDALFAEQGYDFDKVFYWLLLASKTGMYAGSAITTLNRDVKALHETRTPEEAVEMLVSRLSGDVEMKPEDFFVRFDRATSRFCQLLMYLLLLRRGARDWLDRVRIGVDKDGLTRLAGFSPNWHHIFPRALLRDKIPDEQVQAMANLTILTSDTNCRRLKDKAPSEYIRLYKINSDLLREHLIPEPFVSNPAIMVVDRYVEFIRKRAELLAEEANRFLTSLLR